ncbi:MAG: type 4a pilus biogenesis protein PilO [Bacteroidetes bacterium]|nr:type 4a pilus biogenesis protein PilO [Bacteroidota bacterium]MBU1114215.1 type 4a pilus biogenesis protein PilO [Bacteroidota bacterium]MBU1797024.1 type 4a pilus biogenesis protein PilO [Bacteroidota bacterium]
MKINNKKWKNINVIIIVFTIVVLFGEILPRIWDLSSLTINWINDTNKLDKVTAIDANLYKLTETNKKLKSQINQIVSDYEENKNISTTMRYLNNIAKKSNISITSIKPSKLKSNENLWLLPVELEFNSNYEELYNFIRFLESSEKVILVTEISINPITITQQKLKVLTKINVYLNL